MRRIWFAILSLLIWCGCSSTSSSNGFRIGIDPDWTDLSVDAQRVPFINGFVDEVLLEISHYSGLEFIRVRANWDSLSEGMRKESYDAALSAMPPYSFNTARFDFSKNLLDVGTVLVVPIDSKAQNLSDLKNEVVGFLATDRSELLFPQASSIPRAFPLVPDLLNALALGQIEGALLDRLTAASYVKDLYAGQLKIVGHALDHQGIHLIVPKGADKSVCELFDKSLQRLEKSQKLQQIAEKWNLY